MTDNQRLLVSLLAHIEASIRRLDNELKNRGDFYVPACHELTCGHEMAFAEAFRTSRERYCYECRGWYEVAEVAS